MQLVKATVKATGKSANAPARQPFDVPEPTTFSTPDADPDLGFGSVVSKRSRRRLLNRDGSFNVRRRGLGLWSSLSPYYGLLTMPWWGFGLVVTLSYLLINLLFAAAYILCGPDALSHLGARAPGDNFVQAFFFSVQTFASIGYGRIAPMNLAANLLVVLEALVGLFSLGLATGIIFARFSRPTARIIFSRQAVVAPYRGERGFMFQIVNPRRSQLVRLNTEVTLSIFDAEAQTRHFYPLTLERNQVTFFPLTWTIVHPIDPKSPLHALNDDELHRMNAEFLILLTGFDETFSQTVHTRYSYVAKEVVWNTKFADVFSTPQKDGLITVDIRKLDELEQL